MSPRSRTRLGQGVWHQVTGGESGATVHRRADGAAFAKSVVAPQSNELRAEYERTSWLADRGFPCPRVLDWVEDGHGAHLVTSAVPGLPASQLSVELALEAWPAIVGVVQDLHTIPVLECPFERRLKSMIDLARGIVADGAVNPAFLHPEQRVLPVRTLLDAIEAEQDLRLEEERHDLVVCHGDACLPNFMVDPQTLRVTCIIDLGRLGAADRHADLSLLWANATDELLRGDPAGRAAELLTSAYSAREVDQARLRFYLLLDPLTWRAETSVG